MLLSSPIEHQANFPQEDLTDTNAEVLCVMLSSRELVRQGHEAAEIAAQIYKLGHKALSAVVARCFESPSSVAAFNQGVATYETISSLVTHPPRTGEEVTLLLNAFGIERQMTARNLDNYIEEAADQLVLATPRTAQVIAETAANHINRYGVHLAVIGAAAARRFELDNSARPGSIIEDRQ